MRYYVNRCESNCISHRISITRSVFLQSLHILVDLYITVYFPPSLCLCLPVSHVFLEPAGGKRGREGGPNLTAILFPKCVHTGMRELLYLVCSSHNVCTGLYHSHSNQTHLGECVGSLSTLTAAAIYHACVCEGREGQRRKQPGNPRGNTRTRVFKITTLLSIEITKLQDCYIVLH